MIECNGCKARVSLNMKHSIKNNECPYCGSNLIDNQSLKICKSISNDLLNAGFNSKILELSLFIFNNYFNNNDNKEEGSEVLQSDDETQINSFSEDELNTSEDQEFHGQDYVPEEDGDLDDEDRVSRLRKLAKNNPILNKKGTVVRRVTT